MAKSEWAGVSTIQPRLKFVTAEPITLGMRQESSESPDGRVILNGWRTLRRSIRIWIENESMGLDLRRQLAKGVTTPVPRDRLLIAQ